MFGMLQPPSCKEVLRTLLLPSSSSCLSLSIWVFASLRRHQQVQSPADVQNKVFQGFCKSLSNKRRKRKGLAVNIHFIMQLQCNLFRSNSKRRCVKFNVRLDSFKCVLHTIAITNIQGKFLKNDTGFTVTCPFLHPCENKIFDSSSKKYFRWTYLASHKKCQSKISRTWEYLGFLQSQRVLIEKSPGREKIALTVSSCNPQNVVSNHPITLTKF